MLLFTDNMLHCTIPTAVFNCLKSTVVSKVANPEATGIILSGNHDRQKIITDQGGLSHYQYNVLRLYNN